LKYFAENTKTMKKLLLIVIVTAFCFISNAQESTPPKQFMQITSVESVVAGGLGRSKMIITKVDGSQEEKDLNNLFSMGGINFKNIKENEATILRTIKQYTDDGWHLDQTIPMTLSPGDGGGGIFMTRYLLSRAEVKKGF
jgi:hypothetical protein